MIAVLLTIGGKPAAYSSRLRRLAGSVDLPKKRAAVKGWWVKADFGRDAMKPVVNELAYDVLDID